jgi:hypothetical protein
MSGNNNELMRELRRDTWCDGAILVLLAMILASEVIDFLSFGFIAHFP